MNSITLVFFRNSLTTTILHNLSLFTFDRNLTVKFHAKFNSRNLTELNFEISSEIFSRKWSKEIKRLVNYVWKCVLAIFSSLDKDIKQLVDKSKSSYLSMSKFRPWKTHFIEIKFVRKICANEDMIIFVFVG